MPKISKQKSEEKQSFVLGLLTDNPKLTVREIQESLKVKFAQTMNPATIAVLKKKLEGGDSPIVVAGQTETVPTPEPTAEVAATPAVAVEPEVVVTATVSTPADVSALAATVAADEMERRETETKPEPTEVKVKAPLVVDSTTFVSVTELQSDGSYSTVMRRREPEPTDTKEVEIRPGLVEVVKL